MNLKEKIKTFKVVGGDDSIASRLGQQLWIAVIF